MLTNLPFYKVLPSEEQERISALAAELSRDAATWAAPFGDSFHPRVFDNISAIVAAAAPDAVSAQLALFVHYSLWLYRLDQLLDEIEGSTLDDFEARLAAVKAVAHGARAPSPGDPFEESLAEILGELRRRAGSPILVPEFESYFDRMLDAGRFLFVASRDAAGGGPMPPIEDFLREAAHHVFHVSCCLALLLALGEPVAQDHLRELRPAFLDAATAIRLANDLRTYPKDRAEGRLNILSFGWTDEQVKKRAARHLTNLDRALARAVAAGAPQRSARAVGRLTRVAVEMYGVTDLHHDL